MLFMWGHQDWVVTSACLEIIDVPTLLKAETFYAGMLANCWCKIEDVLPSSLTITIHDKEFLVILISFKNCTYSSTLHVIYTRVIQLVSVLFCGGHRSDESPFAQKGHHGPLYVNTSVPSSMAINCVKKWHWSQNK